jgi:hypothetical protein
MLHRYNICALADNLIFLCTFNSYQQLPPPRWLVAAKIVERRKVLVSDSDRGDCEGFLTFLRVESQKVL